jgi:IS5 family transposase
MRCKRDPQLNLYHDMPKSKIALELMSIALVLDENRDILNLVYNDLTQSIRSDTGRDGMNAEQVLRCAILKQYRELTYDELAFHLGDSNSFRAFAKLKMGHSPSSSTLQDNIKAILPETWEAINRVLIKYAAREGIEKGRTVRTDSTAVDTNIHHPTDSSLLGDGIRIITRLLQEGKVLNPIPGYKFTDHNRAAKKRLLRILNCKKEKLRKQAYRELLSLTESVRQFARKAIACLQAFVGDNMEQTINAHTLLEKIENNLSILDKVIDQTERRVFRGEKVPASEKIVSFIECHTDIIVKGGRDTQYGHKVFLTGGKSGLILDCIIERGNPSDAGMFPALVDRQKEIFGRPPRQMAADGGFASQDNLEIAKGKGIKDAMFAKRRGLSVLEMVKSLWVYKKLRNFRAGIEANISRLKRAFGLDRCNWTGWHGFKKYVWSALVSYNLLVLGTLRTATK